MPNFSSIKDLEKYLQAKILESMKDVGAAAEATVKKHVDTDVYGKKKDPEEYIRTYELRDSVTFTAYEETTNHYEVMVYNDSEQIGSYAPNQHYTVHHWEGSRYTLDYSEYVAETVNDGTSGRLFGTGYWTIPRPFMDNARKEIKEKKLHVQALSNSLKRAGIETGR